MKTLGHLERRTHLRLLFLRGLAAGMPSNPSRETDRLASFLCIEAHNLWTEFSRAYFIAALRSTRTIGGQPVRTIFPPGTSLHSALRQIPNALRRHRQGRLSRLDEPPWHSRRMLLSIVRGAGISNLNQIQAALALPSRVLDDLPTFRHFFAHRNAETAAKARTVPARYAVPNVIHPTAFLCKYPPGRPVTVLEDWLFELESVARAMCI